ncbi:MAG: AMP-binding protein, partial [Pseudomonadota bacterium]
MTDAQPYNWENFYPEGLSWRVDLPVKTLSEFFDEQTDRYGNRPFLNFLGKEWSYAESRAITDKIADGLQKMGVQKGCKVGLFLPNTPYAVWFYYGIIKAGGTVVNYNPLYTAKELIHQVEDSETDFMVTVNLKQLTGKLDQVLEQSRLQKMIVCPFGDILPVPVKWLFPIVKFRDIARVKADETHVLYDNLVKTNGHYTAVLANATEDTAVLQYTGGTTGTPKGAMLTHQNIYANAAQVGLWMSPLLEENRQLSMVGVLPFFHVFAMTAVMNMSLYHGMRILLQPKFELKKVLKLVDREKPDLFAGVPAIYNAIAKYPKINRYDFSSVKFCISGGAPLPAEVKKRFEDMTKCPNLAEGYGLTEASPVTNCNPVRGKVKTGTIGLPLPDTIIEIIDQEDGETVLPGGEKGEVCIIGPQVMKGYYNKPDETAEVFRNGRL